jgi:hypothetical protein
MRWTAAVAVWITGVAWSAAEPIRLATAPERGSVVLQLSAPPTALVQETREVALPAGETTLTLSWAGTRLAGETLRLTLGEAAVRVTGPRLPAAQPQQAEWTLLSPQATETQATFEYVMGGLTWEPEYTLLLDAGAGSGALSAVAVVRNDSGEEFEGARIDLGLAERATADLEPGMVLRLPYMAAAGVRCDVTHVFDAAAGPDTSVRLMLENTAEANLGQARLPAGKMRFFEERGGDRLLIGEARLPATPIGGEAELTLGTAREVAVERRVLRVADVDVRKDVNGRMALWNRDEEVAFLIESQKDEAVVLRIVETLDGEWRMLSNSHEFERKDSARIEFTAPIPAHSKVTVQYKVRRLNLMP